jgi:SAM-dependent methyltransferase
VDATDDDREGLRRTFDSAAEGYDAARPTYPDALFDALVALSGIGAGGSVLEIGCGPGTATRPLAARGLRVTGVELGEAMAAVARRNLAAFPDVDVVCAPFETWDAGAAAPFDLVVAATSWHWLDPSTRYRRAWELLRPGGHLALWTAGHVFPAGGDTFFADVQDVYEEIGEGLPPGAASPAPGELPDRAAEIEATGLFAGVAVRHFDWEVAYDADGYIALLDTFSGHIAMQPWQRERLDGEIRRRLAARPDGLLRRHWGAVLHVARRVP